MAEEMGFIARRQLMVLFDEFKRILDKRPVPKDRVNDACEYRRIHYNFDARLEYFHEKSCNFFFRYSKHKT